MIKSFFNKIYIKLLSKKLKYTLIDITREEAISQVGKGWTRFIDNLYDAKPKDTKVLQVKEKWGGFRFYISSAPLWYFDLISYYETLSYSTCEICGKKGTLRKEGWWKTLCEECNDKTNQ